ncbi:hypothetical protein BGZ51_000046 [Haplosporangium sp. Z 767]|nr:hypothetical protein BGZ51_000046 [Haplosporangium sp. Z 767]
MADLNLFCLVDGESTSRAFPIKISSDDTISDLKELIKVEKTPEFDDIAANKLTLWQVSVPATDDEQDEQPVSLDSLAEKKKLFSPRRLISVGNASKKTKTEQGQFYEAIGAAGLTESAVIDGVFYLPLLTSNELVSVLKNIGGETSGINDPSSPSRTELSLTDMQHLYVRQEYLDLYDEIDKRFNSTVNDNARKRVVVTGTAGIGKSAFLIYFTIRILATSSMDNPPIIIFQEKEGTNKCYMFGGLSTVRYGDLKDFRPFLELSETWYLVDSSPNPLLPVAKTIISASPRAVYSEIGQYQEIAKRITWTYYMAPWTLQELETCRSKIGDFATISEDFLKELYTLIGGVPRYQDTSLKNRGMY